MKKMMVMMVMVAGMAVADITNDMSSALSLYNGKNYVAAKVAYQNIISNYPSAPSNILANAHIQLGKSLDRSNDRSTARAEYDIAVTIDPRVLGLAASLKIGSLMSEKNYEEARAIASSVLQENINDTSKIQLHQQIGMSYKLQKEWKLASDAFQLIVDTYVLTSESTKSYKELRATSLNLLGDVLVKQNKLKEASIAYMTFVKENVSELGAENESDIIWTIFNKITSAAVTKEEYIAFLNYTIQATKATEENAKFLGRLKSELGKMQ